jgi:hypothetical protein
MDWLLPAVFSVVLFNYVLTGTKIDLTSSNIESDRVGAGFGFLPDISFEKVFISLGHRSHGAEHRQHGKNLLQPLDDSRLISSLAGSPTSIIP